MARKAGRPGARPTRVRPLLIALASIALLYGALLPKLRSMQAETERIDQEAQRRDTARSQPAHAADALEAARAAVVKSPADLQANMALAGALAAAGKPDEALGYARQCA